MFCNCKKRIADLEEKIGDLEDHNKVYYQLTDKQEKNLVGFPYSYRWPTTDVADKLEELYAYLNLKLIKTEAEEATSMVIKVKKGGKK